VSVDPAGALLAHLDHQRIVQVYRGAPGDELGSGKFNNPASSAALAALTACGLQRVINCRLAAG
jgi:hypothetical protein